MATVNKSWIIIPRYNLESHYLFAIDLGTCLVKAVFVESEDHENRKNLSGKDGLIKLQMICDKISNVEIILEILFKNKYHEVAGTEHPLSINVIGANSSYFTKVIENKFHLRLNTLSDRDCFVKAFLHLGRCMPTYSIIHDQSEQTQAKLKRVLIRMFNLAKLVYRSNQQGLIGGEMNNAGLTRMQMMKDNIILSDMSSLPLMEVYPDMFPCILVILGSRFHMLEVEADGSYIELTKTTFGGDTFMGLGSLLTGIQTYEELVGLVSQGDCDQLHMFATDTVNTAAVTTENDSSAYRALFGKKKDDLEDFTFFFGKPSLGDIDDIKQEDKAAALAQLIATELVQVLHPLTLHRKRNHVFLCGSFTNTEDIRTMIWIEFIRKTVFMMLHLNAEGMETRLHFLKAGSHLGALGALMS